MENQRILILDFGGQYSLLIARRVRECHVYCELRPYQTSMEKILAFHPIGIILTGGPESVLASGSPRMNPAVFSLGVPVLGICYGFQLMARELGGRVIRGEAEYGKASARYDSGCPLFRELPEAGDVWMSHRDSVDSLPDGFFPAARTDACPVAAMYDPGRKLYGTQFHPEVSHTEYGTQILRNFLYAVCGAVGDWTMTDYKRRIIREIREKVGDGQALLALSGGVDSSVCAALLSEAIGTRLACVFVDHGLLRKDEGDEVEAAFSGRNLRFVRINARERFLKRLVGVTEPEQKRKIIGEEFIRVFEEESKRLGAVEHLAQGTIYPDAVESGTGGAAVIKSHHNVGGLPDTIAFREILEPLRLLFKDEVRQLGRELGLPEVLVSRQPFPGPGLAIRILGEVTEEKLECLRMADFIFRDEMAKANPEHQASQYFAVLTNLRSVGVMGDSRTYDNAVALRAVTTDDFMTATWTRIPFATLDRISTRIVNEVPGVNRVLYDITSKPPATVEYE